MLKGRYLASADFHKVHLNHESQPQTTLAKRLYKGLLLVNHKPTTSQIATGLSHHLCDTGLTQEDTKAGICGIAAIPRAPVPENKIDSHSYIIFLSIFKSVGNLYGLLAVAIAWYNS